ncbi:thiopeptide-type bacteriocin biosynthesis protein [Roseateles sp.]|uniref:thiopeptide-type bacteriocin biosynthesis protein n=1 Tax=Roseateles sp. TaxID=1971397 RepID=UPI003BA6D6EA
MTMLPTDATTARWVYVKLYGDRAVEHMDSLLVAWADDPVLTERAESWFFLRYVDERGVHVRLRALTREGDDRDGLMRALVEACTARATAACIDIHAVEDRYAPETGTYGARPGMDAAERLFHRSSRLAAQVLALEERGLLSRKDLLPVLMQDAADAFVPRAEHAGFWAGFGDCCLHGRSPAAADWRRSRAAAGREPAAGGIRIVAAHSRLGEEARAIVAAWRAALGQAAVDYAALGRPFRIRPEMLAFKTAHLMNNRLGLAAVEEAYVAALLELQAQGQGVGALE